LRLAAAVLGEITARSGGFCGEGVGGYGAGVLVDVGRAVDVRDLRGLLAWWFWESWDIWEGVI